MSYLSPKRLKELQIVRLGKQISVRPWTKQEVADLRWECQNWRGKRKDLMYQLAKKLRRTPVAIYSATIYYQLWPARVQ